MSAVWGGGWVQCPAGDLEDGLEGQGPAMQVWVKVGLWPLA